MNKLSLMRYPHLFQGKKYLSNTKNYFEGWYFKNSNTNETISLIPGISINKNIQQAFIQVITNHHSFFISYSLNEFHYSHQPFFIKINNNYFSQNKVHIEINDSKQNLFIKGDFHYSNHQMIKTHIVYPNIMGPFSYIPFMECNHAIMSMKNCVNGHIKVNEKVFYFENDHGYIEKDWGISFPKSYIWLQGNQFHHKNVSFMLSVADIPFHIFHFQGLICILKINHQEYKFTTYNFTKMKEYYIDKNILHILLQKNHYTLEIQSQYHEGHILSAPVKGQMIKNINESLSSKITVTLKYDNHILFSDTSNNCGLEIVKEFSK